jgi:hypothetical protein
MSCVRCHGFETDGRTSQVFVGRRVTSIMTHQAFFAPEQYAIWRSTDVAFEGCVHFRHGPAGDRT